MWNQNFNINTKNAADAQNHCDMSQVSCNQTYTSSQLFKHNICNIEKKTLQPKVGAPTLPPLARRSPAIAIFYGTKVPPAPPVCRVVTMSDKCDMTFMCCMGHNINTYSSTLVWRRGTQLVSWWGGKGYGYGTAMVVVTFARDGVEESRMPHSAQALARWCSRHRSGGAI